MYFWRATAVYLMQAWRALGFISFLLLCANHQCTNARHLVMPLRKSWWGDKDLPGDLGCFLGIPFSFPIHMPLVCAFFSSSKKNPLSFPYHSTREENNQTSISSALEIDKFRNLNFVSYSSHFHWQQWSLTSFCSPIKIRCVLTDFSRIIKKYFFNFYASDSFEIQI